MKNKAYDNLIYATLSVCFVAITLIMVQACANRKEVPEAQKENVMRLGNSDKNIYEVEFDGVKYIVITTHRGIGICQKATEQPKCEVLHVPGVRVFTSPESFRSDFPPEYLVPGAPYMDGPLDLLPPKIGKDGLPLDNQ
jgi:hypothetical protein